MPELDGPTMAVEVFSGMVKLTVIVAKAHTVEGYVEMFQRDVPAEGLHHRKAAGIFKDGTSHIPVGLCLHRGVLCAVPGDEQQKTQ